MDSLYSAALRHVDKVDAKNVISYGTNREHFLCPPDRAVWQPTSHSLMRVFPDYP